MDEQEIKTSPPAESGEPSTTLAPGLKTYTVEEKLAFMRAYDTWRGPMEAFCREAGITSASLCKWRRLFKAYGEEGLQPQANARNLGGRSREPYAPEERGQRSAGSGS